MKRRILLGIATSVVVGGLSGSVFGQAIAESALTHVLSSTATTQAGSTLGRSLNQATAATQSRISSTMSTAASRMQPNAQRAGSASQTKMAIAPKTTMGGTMGLTIRGGRVSGGNNANVAHNTTPNVSASPKPEVQPGNTPPVSK
jgi:hypothetical protein